MARKKVIILDYGVGNCQSVGNALAFLGADFGISADVSVIARADAFILPGVGAFHEAMKNIDRAGFRSALEREVLARKKPLLGICLGMQIMAEDSDEKGLCRGLGWIAGHVRRIPAAPWLLVPQTGWNAVHYRAREHVFARVENGSLFYFNHSFHFEPRQEECVTATCMYGDELVVALRQENLAGVQFHPEKSHDNGLRLLRGFLNLLDAEGPGSQRP